MTVVDSDLVSENVIESLFTGECGTSGYFEMSSLATCSFTENERQGHAKGGNKNM